MQSIDHYLPPEHQPGQHQAREVARAAPPRRAFESGEGGGGQHAGGTRPPRRGAGCDEAL